MTTNIHRVLTLGLLVLSLLWSPTAITATKLMTILSGKDDIYRQVVNGISLAFQQDNRRDDIEIVQHVLSSDGIASAREMFGSLSETDVIVSIGTSATEFVLASGTGIRHLSVLIPEARFDVLLAKHGNRESAYRSVIFLDQPVERQISLISRLFPPDAEVGALIGSNRHELKRRIDKSADQHSISVNISEIRPDQNVVREIRRLVTDNDLGLAVDDAFMLQPSVAKSLLYTAYQSRKPVIAFSKAYLKAGALAVVFSTPEQFGRQAGEEIQNLFDPDWTGHSFRSYSRYFTVDFNNSVARSLGMSLPDKEEVTLFLNNYPAFAK